MTKNEAMQMALDALWKSFNVEATRGDLLKAINILEAALAQPDPELVVWEALVESVRQMRDVQGMDGNWNYDPYMHGLFNGIEFSLSLIEVREPKFRDAPEKWGCDAPKARIFSGKKTHG